MLSFAGSTVDEQIAQADGEAARLIVEMREELPVSKAGKRPNVPPIEFRWEVLNLIEGFHRRGRPPSETLRIALAWALGLFDKDGRPVSIALEGVVARQWFMRAARIDAYREAPSVGKLLDELASRYAEEVPHDEDLIRRFRANPFYQFVVEKLRSA